MSNMNETNFHSDLKIGKMGENFFHRYLGRLSGKDDIFYAEPIDKHEDHPVSGMDLYCLTLTDGQLAYGSFEVKSYYKNAIITYGPNGMPTVGFELWSNEYKPRNEWTPGWLYTYGHAPEYNKHLVNVGAETRVIMPCGLINLYYTGTKAASRNDIPFAAVSFPNYAKLWDRLKEIAMRKFKWDLDAWNLPPAANEDYWNSIGRDVMQNIWNVDLAELADLAIVTIIEDGRLEYHNSFQPARYATLQKYSNGRRLNTLHESLNLAKAEELHQEWIQSGTSDCPFTT